MENDKLLFEAKSNSEKKKQNSLIIGIALIVIGVIAILLSQIKETTTDIADIVTNGNTTTYSFGKVYVLPEELRVMFCIFGALLIILSIVVIFTGIKNAANNMGDTFRIYEGYVEGTYVSGLGKSRYHIQHRDIDTIEIVGILGKEYINIHSNGRAYTVSVGSDTQKVYQLLNKLRNK